MGNIGIVVPILALSIPIVAIVMNSWRRVRERQLDLAASTAAGLNDELLARLGRLEERIAVLERIATDGGNRLAHEIERLRH